MYANTGQPRALFGLLTNFDFLDIKTTQLGVQSVISDYEHLTHPNIFHHSDYQGETVAALRLIQKALQQAANILEEDSKQLPSQLLARLLPLNNPLLQKLLEGEGNARGAKDCDIYPWLEPLIVTIDTPNQAVQRTITTNHDGDIDAIAISGDGKLALSAKENQLKVWDLVTGENKHTLEIDTSEICNKISVAALSWDGRWAAVGLYAYIDDKKVQGVIHLWDLEEGKFLCRFSEHEGTISALAISQNGQQIVAAYKTKHYREIDPRVWILDEWHSRVVTSVTLRHILFTRAIPCIAVAITPNGQWAVTASHKFLSLWNIPQERLVNSISLTGKEIIKILTISSEGKVTAAFDNGTFKIWDFHNTMSFGGISSEIALDLFYWCIRYPYSKKFIAWVLFLLQEMETLLEQDRSRNRYEFDSDDEGLEPVLYFTVRNLYLIHWCIRYSYSKKLITWILFLLQENIVNFFYLLAKLIDFSFGNFSEIRDFSDYRSRLSDLEKLWTSLRVLSFTKPQEIIIINLKNFNLLDSFTSNGLMGLCKTKTGDIQVTDLTLVSSTLTKKGNKRSTHSITQRLREPWENVVAVSLDGRYIFSFFKENTLKMWDITGSRVPLLLKRKKISSLWERLVMAFNIGIKVRKKEASLPLHSFLFHKDIVVKNINVVAKSLSGRWLFLVSNNTFDVRDLASQDLGVLSHWKLKDVSPNGHWALWQSCASTLRLTNLKTGKVFGFLQDCYDNNLITTNYWISKVEKSWKEANWKYRQEPVNNAPINSEGVSISADGNTVLFCDSGFLDTWLWQPFQCLMQWHVDTDIVHPVLPAYQQPKLTGQETLPQQEWILSITAFTVSSDGKKAFFGLKNGELKFCDFVNNKVLYSFTGHRMSITSVSFSQDDQWAVSCSLDQTLKVWSLPTCTQVASFTINNPLYFCKITLTLDGRLLVVSSNEEKHVQVFNLRLPDSYDLISQEQQFDAEESNQEINSSPRKLLLAPQNYWQSTFGIPLRLDQLKNLSEELNSEVGIDYSHLRELLRTAKWKEANQETKRLMLKALNRENLSTFNLIQDNTLYQDIRNFPGTDLLTIDRLWLKYSNGRYGFSLQMRIWQQSQNSITTSFFYRAIRQSINNLIPCESPENRRGNFPYFWLFSSRFLREDFFIRLAECSGYLYTNSPKLNNKVIEAKERISTCNEEDSFYRRLHILLAEKEWEEANKETVQRLLSNNQISLEELQKIDDLWIKHSNQRFGLSTQKRIWEEVDQNFELFFVCVGWKNEYLSRNFEPITFDSLAPEGHLPVTDVFESERFLKKIFSCLETHFPATRPYPIQIRAFPQERSSSTNNNIIDLSQSQIELEVKVRGTGILDLRLYHQNNCIYRKYWIYKKNRLHYNYISIELPDSWKWIERYLTGSLILKPFSGKILFSPFISIKIYRALERYERIENFNIITQGSILHQRLEIKKHFLGENHRETEKTLEEIVKQYEEAGCIEAEFFRYQQWKLQKSRQEIEIGNETSAIIISLSPDEIVPSTSSEKQPIETSLIKLEETISEQDEEKSNFYARLRYLLAAREWEEANKETFQRLKDYSDELQIIDDLWLEHSYQRFGFSVQRRIWEEVDCKLEVFCERIGWNWIYNPPDVSIEPLTFHLSAPEGHLPLDPQSIEAYQKVNYFLGRVGFNLSASSIKPKRIHFDTYFSKTAPYSVHLKGLPKQWAHLKIQVKGTGILILRLYQNGYNIFSNHWIYKENKVHDCNLIHIPLPSNIWEKDLTGSLVLKPFSGQVLSYPFVVVRISCPIDQQNIYDVNRLEDLNQDFELYQLLEMQKRLLGESHPDIELTLERLIQKCKQIKCYEEAELFKQQKLEYQQNQKNRQRIEVGNESSAIILFLNPDEEALQEALKPSYITHLPEIKLSHNHIKATANRIDEKLTRTIQIKNSVPQSLLSGTWEIVAHPNDPPHTNNHSWISITPKNFSSNQVICKITVDTSNLAADSVYERWLYLHTNASVETCQIKLTVKTAPLPKIKKEKLFTSQIAVLLISFLETFVVSTLTSNESLKVWGWYGTSILIYYAILSIKLLATPASFYNYEGTSLYGIPLRNKINPILLNCILGFCFVVFIFTAQSFWSFWWVFPTTGMFESVKYSFLLVFYLSSFKNKYSLYNSIIALLTIGFCNALGYSLKYLNPSDISLLISASPFAVLSLVVTGFTLATLVIYPSLKKWIIIARYHLLKQHLIDPVDATPPVPKAVEVIDAVKDQDLISEAEPLRQEVLESNKPLHKNVFELDQRLSGYEHPSAETNLSSLADLYISQGRYNEAESLYQQALKLNKRLLGEYHIDVATSLDRLALVYLLQKRYNEAEPLYQQALELRKRLLGDYNTLKLRILLLGDSHIDVATSLDNLALVYRLQERYNEAEPLYQQALELRKRLLGEEHLDVVDSLNSLAFIYRLQERYSEAEPLYQQALELRKRLLGEEHLDVADSLGNLAFIYFLQRRYSKAEPLYQQALELRKRLLGEEHPLVATSLNSLAFVYQLQERYSEAESLFKQVLELNKRLLGEEHTSVAYNLNSLALIYQSQGRYTEAEPLFKQALELNKRLLGEEHTSVADSLNSLALIYQFQGRYIEAEVLFKQSLEMRKRLLGEEHLYVVISLSDLATLYDEQGRYNEGEPLFQQILTRYKPLLEEENPVVANLINSLAYSYSSQGRYTEAETLCRQALEMRKRIFGEDDSSVAGSLNTLARLYNFQGRHSEAEPLYQQALEMRKRLLGEEHPYVARSLNGLAGVYVSQNKHKEAKYLYLEALKIFEKKLGENHPDTINCRNTFESL
ncbi:tetratricopeptide repeat protein [Nostoc sp. ChiQUE01b]|uniref:tetratricopeptide repeat protein n=1 Tax=Nostoc sp. ChiQUE01b TaxID=3075376 RepID=UPI002AD33E16|nr:tetratricopeptide repeat protein [Nostoc sp. ChiQUE01b]MDZ8260602.1 tetratricopeptide repeat protein [Nostoc sp. ChiQUE01b]